ncbi:hypothetical protein M3P05_05530 [Sansalvadorimonas sp. 2012CJ34-2]|uniref:Peptidase C39 domain-containing protein n=1 Tax=Parendozoicomonas callyspongiae TaxID=2942213 RepID=A0ABT0PDR8_9GAMM|nr:hypothetical protein [Sansalvadorimonas sp. 2012CJ34-2]MCL6269406.1 hypothetical protein [Sansalvadorimonas sp. 2012CJ34-2]
MAARTPFSYQVSAYDCVPISFINALAYLFERDDIPPLVIQKIYLYCLDTVTAQGELGHGTTGLAVALLGNWLQKYREGSFALSTTYLDREKVNCTGRSQLEECLNRKGTALVRLHTGKKLWHYVLALSMDDEWFYAFDPCRRKKKSIVKGAVEYLLDAREQQPNLRIRRQWLDTLSNRKRFALGTLRERECLLIERPKLNECYPG